MQGQNYKIFYAIFFGCIYLLQGTLFTLIPYTDALIHQLFFKGIIEEWYSFLFAALGAGGVLAALLCSKLIQIKGCSTLYKMGIISHLFALYLVGMVLLTAPSPILSTTLFMISLFFWGAGFGIILPLSNVLVYSYFPKKPERALFGFYALNGLSGFLTFLPPSIFWFFLLFAIVSYSILFLFFDFFFTPETSQEGQKLRPSKKRWPLYVALLVVGFYISFIFNWPSNPVSYPLFWGYILAILSRLVVAIALLWISLRGLIWILPLCLFLSTLLVPFTHGIFQMASTSSIFFFTSCLWPALFCFGLKYFYAAKFEIASRSVAAALIGYGFASFIFGTFFKNLESSGTLYLISSVLTLIILIFCIISLTTPEGREKEH